MSLGNEVNAAIAFGQIIDAVQQARFIVVVGLPATGKTFITQQMFMNGQYLNYIATDNYMRYPFDEALYVMIKDLKRELVRGHRVCVEGVQGFRLLRKIWQQNWKDKPDLVIFCQATQDKRRERLNARGSDYRMTFRMDAMLMKIWKDYELLADTLAKADEHLRNSQHQKPTTLYYDTSNL